MRHRSARGRSFDVIPFPFTALPNRPVPGLRAGHPRLSFKLKVKTWVAGTSPATGFCDVRRGSLGVLRATVLSFVVSCDGAPGEAILRVQRPPATQPLR